MHTCETCGKDFKSGRHLAGHKTSAHKPWDEIRKDITRKTRLIEERGHRCESCKLTTWQEQPIPIHLDHKDCNPNNNTKDNLRLICPNCHAQTDTYCGRNIGRPKCIAREKAKYPNYRGL